MSQPTPSVTDLRAHLFDQLRALRATPLTDPEALKAALQQASAVAELAKVITDTAKVEVDYIRACGGEGQSSFLLDGQAVEDQAPGTRRLPGAPGNGITGIVRHTLEG